MSFLVGPAEQDYELEDPEDDGAFVGVPPHAMGTWCQRSCVAFGVSFTPFAVAHLPLVGHDFGMQLGAPYELLFGRPARTALRTRVRSARTLDDKMHAFLQWIECLLLDRSRPASSRRRAGWACRGANSSATSNATSAWRPSATRPSRACSKWASWPGRA
jgi:hypothetical protein